MVPWDLGFMVGNRANAKVEQLKFEPVSVFYGFDSFNTGELT